MPAFISWLVVAVVLMAVLVILLFLTDVLIGLIRDRFR